MGVFEDNLNSLITRLGSIRDQINTEEATKTSLIMPFFQTLGYDVFNPNEFIPEYIADVGIKKGEKVDYAIVLGGNVSILVEAKCITEKLEKHDSQLFRYFGTSKAKFAILTNGIEYKFYTDLEKQNIMDTAPFLIVNLDDLKDTDVIELKKFQKENFDIDSIYNSASDLKYLNQIRKVLKEELVNPTDGFVKFILNEGVFEGSKTQAVIEKYRPLVKKSFNVFINEVINERLQSAMTSSDETTQKTEEIVDDDSEEKGVVTTMDEMDAYYIIRSILSEYVDPNRISYKDTLNYFAVLVDNKVTKWICRIYLRERVKFLIISDSNGKDVRYDITKNTDIYKLRKQLKLRLYAFIDNTQID